MKRINWQLTAFCAFAVFAILVGIRAESTREQAEETRDAVAKLTESNRQSLCAIGRFLPRPAIREGESARRHERRLTEYHTFRSLLLDELDCRAVLAQIKREALPKGVVADTGDSPSEQPGPPPGGSPKQPQPPAPKPTPEPTPEPDNTLLGPTITTVCETLNDHRPATC